MQFVTIPYPADPNHIKGRMISCRVAHVRHMSSQLCFFPLITTLRVKISDSYCPTPMLTHVKIVHSLYSFQLSNIYLFCPLKLDEMRGQNHWSFTFSFLGVLPKSKLFRAHCWLLRKTLKSRRYQSAVLHRLQNGNFCSCAKWMHVLMAV